MSKQHSGTGNGAARQPSNNGMPSPPATRAQTREGQPSPQPSPQRRGGEAGTADTAVAPPTGVRPPDPDTRNPEPGLQRVSISVPIGPAAGGYQTDRIDMQLRPRECAAMHQVLAGLREARACKDDGTFVQNVPDVVRWLMQRVAAQGV